MSLNPIDSQHMSTDDVDLGNGAKISNNAQSMHHYSVHAKRPSDASRSGMWSAVSLDDTAPGEGMRTYGARGGHAAPKNKKRGIVIGVIVAAVALAVIAAIVAVLYLNVFSRSANEGEVVSGEITVTIPTGYGAGDIAQILRDNGVIESTTPFVQAVSSQGAESELKPGTYTFEAGSSYEEIVEALVAGPATAAITLTIPEGYTVAQTAQRVADTIGTISYDEFMAQAKASNYVGEFSFLAGVYNDSLEGFLFPKTYSFDEGVTADTVIRTMLQQYQNETASLNWTTATLQDGTALTQYQVVILASLIERETAVPEERANVASVIYNRLNAGMALQIDAVIAYALNKADLITYDDLNTVATQYPEFDVYNNPGLPPAPICSPSLASIQAALAPAQTSYYYYVASSALDGTHVFCSTDEEFAVARDAYNAAMGITG